MHVDEDQLALANYYEDQLALTNNYVAKIFKWQTDSWTFLFFSLKQRNAQMLTEVHKLFFTDTKGNPDRLHENPSIFL